MGAADIVPGVSGGTIALITGIYEELIESIRGIDFTLFKILFKDEQIGEYDLLALEDVKRQNIFSRLISSINFLIWGDV